jgi:hypothetical protein
VLSARATTRTCWSAAGPRTRSSPECGRPQGSQWNPLPRGLERN